MDKPYAPACDRNREPILARLREYLSGCRSVLEIGSGTGQHAVYFAAAFPHLRWQTSDCAQNLPGIRLWLDEAALPNTPAPLELDVNGSWPATRFDTIFTANTFHIMAWADVVQCFARVPAALAPAGYLMAYGPFNYGGAYTSDSNAAFDTRLKTERQHQGLRNFEDVDALARGADLTLVHDHAMPANNRLLVWRRAR